MALPSDAVGPLVAIGGLEVDPTLLILLALALLGLLYLLLRWMRGRRPAVVRPHQSEGVPIEEEVTRPPQPPRIQA